MVVLARMHVIKIFMLREEAIVAVFGDLDRSPRMINHTRELLKSGFYVHLIGYFGGIW